MTRRTKLAALVLTLASGCGGATPAADAGPDAPVAAVDAGTDAGRPPCPSSAWPTASADREAAVLAELDARRAAGATCGTVTVDPSSPLTVDTALTEAARCHAFDMMLSGTPSPTGSDGSTDEVRAARAGYTGMVTVEVFGDLGDTQTPAEIVDLVLTNAAHCQAILSPLATDVGFGMSRDPAAVGVRTTYFEILVGR